ncbi:TIGR04255 family protein [Candidatus Poribacteria bacterium]|nr:TIGR04255 family protein [Candidatus Poribacteria bacterium]
MFSISQVGEYVGWDLFSDKIFSTLNQVRKSGVIVNIERIGLRYINILEGVNLFENSNLTVSLKDKALARKTNVTTEIPFDKGVSKIMVTSDAEAQLGGDNGRKICGSVIDIDVSINTGTFDDLQEDIEYAHTVEKEAFFSILKDEYIKTLNPEY